MEVDRRTLRDALASGRHLLRDEIAVRSEVARLETCVGRDLETHGIELVCCLLLRYTDNIGHGNFRSKWLAAGGKGKHREQ